MENRGIKHLSLINIKLRACSLCKDFIDYVLHFVTIISMYSLKRYLILKNTYFLWWNRQQKSGKSGQREIREFDWKISVTGFVKDFRLYP